ncbi:protein BIG GRAIN 1-like A [Mercurialis annua]|uniref:protein BIG GRAIN 1-like A n=1 Tax=Mercurialis annua TaxID=3986 RepID=UPI00215E0D57|nr:protein BIG GRAIN 1-like A [Mercurialis annua]
MDHQRENPSFSSTLLDAIYRSIDESNGGSQAEEELFFNRKTMRSNKKHINNGLKDDGGEYKATSLKKACMIQKWMDEKDNYGGVRKSTDSNKKSFNIHSVLLNSSSSSSESSCGGGFSSSECESVYGLSSRSSSINNSYTMQRPKPIRTSVSVDHDRVNNNVYAPKQKHESLSSSAGGSFVKTKSRALKIYGDLKKVKQPISPGGRLASFLNSIFTPGNAKNAKKAKFSSNSPSGFEERKLKSEQASTCSSASSFSRSCLSKTPSSRGNGAKRSVRFYPVSVIVDEDSRPCGHKSLYNGTENQESTNVLRNYQKKNQEKLDFCNGNVRGRYINQERVELDDDDDDNDDDDAASYASSDLFELDNLSAIGIERYREELPVYETTHLHTNRAIANGLIL